MQNRNWLRVVPAWGVHALTASGAVWGFLALLAVIAHDWRMAIIWMIVAMLVDSLDGMLARWLRVSVYARQIDGDLLDNIIDYLNYVIVPALFLIEAPSLLPAGLELVAALSILISSAYQFTQVDAKTEDHFFKGFPSYWNVLVLYMLLLKLNVWVNLAFLVIFNVLVFIPLKYIYPSRNTRLRRLTLILSWMYAVLGIWALLKYPQVPAWAIWASFIYVFYYTWLSLWPRNRRLQAS